MQERATSNGYEDQRVAVISFIQDWCHRPDVLHTILYPVLRPDAGAISTTAKGVLWAVLFGLAKTCQYGGLTILGVEGYKRLRNKFRKQ